MLPFFIIAIIIAWFKKYKPLNIFKTYTIYPFIFFELMFWVMQIMASYGIQETVRYAGILKFCFFASLLIPIFHFKLYKHALIGSGLVFVGSIMNKLVMQANNGKMPVFFSVSKITGFANEAMFNAPGSIHIMMSSETSLNFLGDIFDFGYCVMSVGDIIMKTYFIIIFYQMIKTLNQNDI